MKTLLNQPVCSDMKTAKTNSDWNKRQGILTFLRSGGRAVAAVLMTTIALVSSMAAPLGAVETGKTFSTPEEAVTALSAAVNSKDGEALHALFGPAVEDIRNPDRVQATNEFNTFAAALEATNRLVHESDTKCVLEVGEGGWPFPVPIVKNDGKWFFDTEAGKEEILNRRIGSNELATLQVMRACVDAEREYASQDRDGDGVLKYAQRFISHPGTRDGLYWPTEPDGEVSPLGPLVAEAQSEGYGLQSRGGKTRPQPYHGYFFKILTRQGRHAPGGKYDYLINGNMIGGFAILAWPAEYGRSGIMTFMVNQRGLVYQKDLGPKTGKLAPDLTRYDPDPGWQLSPD